SRARILDTQHPVHGLIVHKAKVLEGTFTAGEKVELIVDADRRAGLRRNHSATHLLHRTLREVLGETVKQAGSVVAPDYLRFDYTAYQPLTDEQRMEIERRVNQLVYENHEAETKEMDPESAMKSGAIAFFGDKYTQLAKVRVLQIGPSVELCGGTHVSRSGDIGFFKIVSEGAIAAGVRRIVAVTSDLSKKYPAGNLVKELSKTLGGRGGGKPELAQAGGGDPAQLDAALARAYELV